MINPIVRMVDCHIIYRDKNSIKYLLLKRSPDKVYPNIWQCVTGKIEGDEKAYQTAIREVKEETRFCRSSGLVITVSKSVSNKLNLILSSFDSNTIWPVLISSTPAVSATFSTMSK